jgi:hypothetical protein
VTALSGGKIVPAGTLPPRREKGVLAKPCSWCRTLPTSTCEPGGDHLARYSGAWRAQAITPAELTLAWETAQPERVWVAQWVPEGVTGTLTVTDMAGRLWLTAHATTAVMDDGGLRDMLAVYGWATVPGSVWVESPQSRSRHVYPMSAEVEARIRADLGFR